MPRLVPAAAILCLCLLLCGCWLPEHYIARIRIERDASYKLYLEGTAVNTDAWREIRRLDAEAKGPKAKPDDLKKKRDEALAKLQEEIAQASKDGRVMNASSIGDGRVRFSLGGSWNMDRGVLIASELSVPIAYAVGPDGTVRVHVKDALHTAEARSLGVRTTGDLAITLAEGVEVLEHNAQKTPTSPGGAYRWHIDETSTQAPYLKLRFPSASAPEPAGRGQGAAGAQKGLAHH